MAGYAKEFIHKGAGGAGAKPRYGNFCNLLAQGTIAPAIDTLWAAPVRLKVPGTVNAIGFKVTTVGGASNKTRVGLFTNLLDTVLTPGKLIVGVDTGEIDSNASTGVKETALTGGPLLDAGLYWLVLWQGAGTAATYASVAVGGTEDILGVDDTLTGITGISAARTYNTSGFSTLATPNTFPSSSLSYVTAAMPLLYVRLTYP
jgi:hypothetical protein